MKHLSIAFCLLSLVACSNNQLINQQIENAAIKQAAESNVSPEQAVINARNAFTKATQDGLSFYTPLHIKNAQNSLLTIEKLQQAEKNKTNNSQSLAVITESFKTIELINNAYKVKTTIESTLTESLANKRILEELNTPTEFPSDYADMLEDLQEAFKLIENNKIEDARKKETSVISTMIKLETKTLIKQYVQPAQLVLDKAEDNDADKYAEQTFEQAEDSIKRATAFINNNYRQLAAIKTLAKETLIAAQRANNIGEWSHGMVKLSEKNAELKALEIENLFITINQGAELKEIQGLPLYEQAKIFSELLAKNKNSIAELKQALAEAEHKNVNPAP